MATTDSNGLVQLTATDDLVPLQATINSVTASVSNALNSNVRVFKVANVSARNALALQRTPSASNPLQVWRSDLKKMEINSGSGWEDLTPPPIFPTNNSIVIDGATYQLSGKVTAPASAWSSSSGLVFARTITLTLPKAIPAGWSIIVTCSGTSGFDVVDCATLRGNRKDFTVRHIRFLNGSTTSITVYWHLVKSSA